MWPAEAFAQRLRASDKVTWRVRAERATPGESARILLDARIEDGWRLYAIDSQVGRPLTVTLESLPAGMVAGPLEQSEPQTGYDAGFEMAYPYFARSARLAQRIQVSGAVSPGRHTVSGSVSFTVCNDSVCLPPTRVPFRVPIEVASR